MTNTFNNCTIAACSLLAAGALTGCAYSAALLATLTGVWVSQRLIAVPRTRTGQHTESFWEVGHVSFA